MTAGSQPRWLLTCSCGWTTDISQRWAAESAAKLHPKVAKVGITHTVTIEEPPADPPAGQQLTLIAAWQGRRHTRAPSGISSHRSTQ